MPKSKRNRVVALTQTEKKGRAGKDALFTQVREAADKYAYIWVFSVANMRNTYLKDIRSQWSHSRMFFGRTRVMAKSLGVTPAEEYKERLSELSPTLQGNVGLLFTNEPPVSVRKYFEEFREKDYARAGAKAVETVTIPEGPITRNDEPFPHNMEPQLRQLGMPTILRNGVVSLPIDYTICKEGQKLDSNQTHLLKLFYIQQAEFSLNLLAYYHDGEVHQLSEE